MPAQNCSSERRVDSEPRGDMAAVLAKMDQADFTRAWYILPSAFRRIREKEILAG